MVSPRFDPGGKPLRRLQETARKEIVQRHKPELPVQAARRLFDEPVVVVNAYFDPGTVFDQGRHVFPKIFPTQADQRVA